MATNTHEYWQEMKDKAAANIAHVTKWNKPADEEGVKAHVAHVMKFGNCHEKAEVLVEAFEYMLSCHMLKAHTLQA